MVLSPNGQSGGVPHLQHSQSGLPGPADRETRLGEVPHLSCEHNQEKKRNCIERLVTPPPCEQALKTLGYVSCFLTRHSFFCFALKTH